MKKFTIFLLISFFSSLGNAKGIEWIKYSHARSLESDKMIFIFGEMRLCSVCQKVKKEVFVNAEVINLINENFIPVKKTAYLPTSFTFDDLTGDEGGKLKIKGWPAYIFVKDDKYKVFYGYKSPKEMKLLLKSAVAAS